MYKMTIRVPSVPALVAAFGKGFPTATSLGPNKDNTMHSFALEGDGVPAEEDLKPYLGVIAQVFSWQETDLNSVPVAEKGAYNKKPVKAPGTPKPVKLDANGNPIKRGRPSAEVLKKRAEAQAREDAARLELERAQLLLLQAVAAPVLAGANV